MAKKHTTEALTVAEKPMQDMTPRELMTSRGLTDQVAKALPAIFTPERFGQWLHVATCIDPAAKEVRHYLNGELIARVPRQVMFPVRMTLAELGNWNDGKRGDAVAIRHFSGVMDEFMLFGRVLSEAEIQRLAR
jgi:hypothetical protein